MSSSSKDSTSDPEALQMHRLTKLDSRVLDNGLPYTILTRNEKYVLSCNLALMGLCCSITISIYWVALTQLQRDFHVTEEQINLTITAYLVFQATSPVFVSNLSDHYGRRPVLIVCLTGGLGASIGLALCNTYWLLMLLRCLLGVFLAPIISINSSVIGDFTSGRDRGGFVGVVGGFSVIGQGIAPFLGSLFDARWGWRAIFWFCAAYNALVLLVTIILLPETKRSIAGNMSHLPDKWIHRAPSLVHFRGRFTDTLGTTLEPPMPAKYNPLEPFLMMKDLDVTLILLPCALMYSTWTMSQASLTTNLAKNYHFSTLKIGLSFFAPGFGTIIGALVSGKLMDVFYRRMKKRYVEKWSTNPEAERPPFNVIKARLSLYYICSAIGGVFVLIYGWCLRYHESVAIILVSSFIFTVSCLYPMNSASTLMVDLHPERSGSSTSLNNFYRCGLGAIFVSCLTKMNAAMGIGGTFTFMSGLCALSMGLIWLVLRRSEARAK
ncbi:hypothetical protein FOA43_004644 [Brettanomyces nanus]|uniref:Major facilitator superfamily (MFS) profile domain-containing protein n=1 Tax=Eeniella nana TaxID=13502 RepID=A0A875RYA0_EENNA|nr:uncharacterized protein FOA43_004644 [Brettanomyces nanus]QPG77237.1 hypothetical protein FOA43_004644 [Brettanomyces nanus]